MWSPPESTDCLSVDFAVIVIVCSARQILSVPTAHYDECTVALPSCAASDEQRQALRWRMPPIHCPPWQTVYGWFSLLVRSFLFQVIHDVTLVLDRQAQGRDAQPTAAVIESQTIKAPGAACRGYDAAKRVTGRKRHIAVGADGRLRMVRLTPVDIADSTGAMRVLDALMQRWLWIAFVCRRHVRPTPAAQQGRSPRLYGRGRALPDWPAGLRAVGWSSASGAG